MSRAITLLSLSSVVSLALAAPLPKAADQGFKGGPWGQPFNRGKDCKFTFGKDSVTIEVPAGDHYLGPGLSLEKGKAPGLLRTAKGDFRAQVRVRGEFRPEASLDRRVGSTSAYMVVYGVEGKGKTERAFAVNFGSILTRTKTSTVRTRFAAVHMAREGDRERGGGQFKPLCCGAIDGEEDAGVKWDGVWEAHFRVERRNGELSGYVSLDGKKWHGLEQPLRKWKDGTEGLRMDGEVKVGVAANAGSDGKFKVTFDSFTLTPLMPKKD